MVDVCERCQHFTEDQTEYHYCHVCNMNYDCFLPKDKEKVFYRVITFIELPNEADLFPPTHDTEAYYLNKNDAFQCVLENWCDIYESSYPAAMVIETPFGLYPFCPNRWYFEWEGDWETGGYVEKEEPKSLEHWNI